MRIVPIKKGFVKMCRKCTITGSGKIAKSKQSLKKIIKQFEKQSISTPRVRKFIKF